MRTLIFRWHSDFFNESVAQEDVFSIDIHETNVVGVSTMLLARRNYFRNLFRDDLNRVTLWKVNLWFQLEKSSQPGRRSWETIQSFGTVRWNASGITCGMLFYPGNDGPLNSLRT